MKRFAITISAVALLGAATPASADRIDLSIGSSLRAMHSSSVDALAEDDTDAFFSIAAGFKIDAVRLARLDFLVDVGFDAGSFGGESFNRIDSTVRLKSGMAGARLRWNVSEYGNFYGRGAIGLSHVALELRDSLFGGPYLADDGFSASTFLGGGIELLPVKARQGQRERFAMGLRLEGGYFATTSVSMRAVPRGENTADGALRIPTRYTDLGSLNLSAWTARIAMVTRF